MKWEELREDLISVRKYQEQTDIESKKIEYKMFEEIFSFLRVSYDEKDKERQLWKLAENNNDDTDIMKLENISELAENVSDYKPSELMLHIMLCAHDNWIKDNIDNIDFKSNEMSNSFVPFYMLNWQEIDKRYFSVLHPILNAMKIEINEDKIIKQFMRNQTVYLVNNGIFSKSDLDKNLYLILKDYYISLNQKNKDSIKYINSNKVISNISKSISENIELDGVKRIKDAFTFDKNEIGFIAAKNVKERKQIYKFSDSIGQRKIGFKKRSYPILNKPASKIMFDLTIGNDIILVQNIKKHDYSYIDASNSIIKPIKYITYDECNEEQRKQIAKRDKKVKKFVDKVNNSNSKKYSEPGLITLVSLQNKSTNLKPEILQIPLTLKDLAQMRVLPKEIGWEVNNKTLINSKRSLLIGQGKTTNITETTNNNDFKNRLELKEYEIPVKEQNKTKMVSNKEEKEK